MSFVRVASSLVLATVVAACATHQDRAFRTLSILTEGLASVRNAPGDKKFTAKVVGADISLLVGLTRHELLGSLGSPTGCWNVLNVDLPAEKCPQARVWLYSFYRLPIGWAGGGTELEVSFDPSDVIVKTQWYATQ